MSDGQFWNEEEGIEYEPEEDTIDEPVGEILSESEKQELIALGKKSGKGPEKDLSGEYPSMDPGGEKKLPEEMRNALDPKNEERREDIIRQRVEELRVDAMSLNDYERAAMIEALRKDLEGQMISQLFSYNRERQSDFSALKFKVEKRLGRSIKTTDGETQEAKLNREYPSMSTDPRKNFRRALGLLE